MQPSPSFSQVDADLTFIGGIPASLDVPECFQPFQHWGQGVGLQKQLLAELPYCLTVPSP